MPKPFRLLTQAATALVAAFLAPAWLHANIIEYDFQFTPQDGTTPYSITIDAPGILSEGPVSITPVTVTHGANSWTFTQASVGDHCFMFGTANATLDDPTCSSGGPWGSGTSEFLFFSGMPSTTGSYSPPAFESLTLADETSFDNSWTGSLSITESAGPAPEPGSAGLLLSGLPALLLAFKKRRLEVAWL